MKMVKKLNGKGSYHPLTSRKDGGIPNLDRNRPCSQCALTPIAFVSARAKTVVIEIGGAHDGRHPPAHLRSSLTLGPCSNSFHPYVGLSSGTTTAVRPTSRPSSAPPKIKVPAECRLTPGLPGPRHHQPDASSLIIRFICCSRVEPCTNERHRLSSIREGRPPLLGSSTEPANLREIWYQLNDRPLTESYKGCSDSCQTFTPHLRSAVRPGPWKDLNLLRNLR